MAALPKAPAALHPVRYRDPRDPSVVISRRPPVETAGFKPADADKARKDTLVVTQPYQWRAYLRRRIFLPRKSAADILSAYGEKKLYGGGLSVRATLDPKLQVMARRAMVAGLVKFDEEQALSRRVSKLDISGDGA